MVWTVPAEAVGTCGSYLNNQVGWSSNQTSASQPHRLEGVSAEILTHVNPALCTTSQSGANFSAVWTMVFGSNGYVQSGTKFYPGTSCSRTWAEQSRNGSQADYYGSCVSNSTYYRFWQQSITTTSGGSYLRSNVNSTILHQASFGIAEITNYFGRADVAFEGETYYAATNLPGSTSNPTDFDVIQVQYYSNDSFNGACSGVILGRVNQGNVSRYAEGAAACDDTQVWTRT